MFTRNDVSEGTHLIPVGLESVVSQEWNCSNAMVHASVCFWLQMQLQAYAC